MAVLVRLIDPLVLVKFAPRINTCFYIIEIVKVKETIKEV